MLREPQNGQPLTLATLQSSPALSRASLLPSSENREAPDLPLDPVFEPSLPITGSFVRAKTLHAQNPCLEGALLAEWRGEKKSASVTPETGSDPFRGFVARGSCSQLILFRFHMSPSFYYGKYTFLGSCSWRVAGGRSAMQ